MLLVIALRDRPPAALPIAAVGIEGDPEPLAFLLQPLPGDARAIGSDDARRGR